MGMFRNRGRRNTNGATGSVPAGEGSRPARSVKQLLYGWWRQQLAEAELFYLDERLLDDIGLERNGMPLVTNGHPAARRLPTGWWVTLM